MSGLMWSRSDDYQVVQTSRFESWQCVKLAKTYHWDFRELIVVADFRHTCEQSDGMKSYGWDEYDARQGGEQTIHDEGNGINIKTSFIKIPGGKHGGNWAARIQGTVRPDTPPDLKTTVVYYASLEGLGTLELENDRDSMGYEGDVVLKGASEGLGDYKMIITEGTGKHPESNHPSYAEKPLDRTMVHVDTVPPEVIWQAKPILFKSLKAQIDEYIATYGEQNAPPPFQVYTVSNNEAVGNIYMVQKVFEGDFEFDVIFNSGSASKAITSEDMTKRIGEVSKSYRHRWNAVFKLQPPFATDTLQKFASTMFSNLIGGIGYFYGEAVVDRSYAPEYDEENEGFWEETAEARARKQEKLEGPSELFTAVPSRPFFPRGFLWDEGFHLMPIIEWDVDLTLDIIMSWFNLMDDDGWIGREQILGLEARSKVPPDFQVQYPHYANPPTLFFVLDTFIEKLGASKDSTFAAKLEQESWSTSGHLKNQEAGLQYLRELYPKLKKLFFWIRKTQMGDLKSYDREAFSSKEGYRWRGRTPIHILTSGLDDYPRPQPPHPGELHIDLMSWVGMMTRSMKNIATLLDYKDDVVEFTDIDTAITHNIDDLHWSEKDSCYCDATIDAFEEHTLVCHKGYISLFPLLTGLMDGKDEKLGHILALIGDESELWSDYGIRSLSRKSEFYGTGENYWRGPIWMPLNYMALVQLYVSPLNLQLTSVALLTNVEIRQSPRPIAAKGHGTIFKITTQPSQNCLRWLGRDRIRLGAVQP